MHFQVFLLSHVFGLFHGLVFLPVILGLVGTMPKEVSEDKDSSSSTSVDSDVERESATTPSASAATTDSGLASSVENNNKKHSNNGKTLLGISNEGYVFDEVCNSFVAWFISFSLLHNNVCIIYYI